MPTTPLLSGARRVQSLLVLLVRQGGQQQARRNAWAAMSAGAARGRERRLADAAVRSAEQRAGDRASAGGSTGS